MANKSNKKLVETNQKFLQLHFQILAAILAFYLLIRVVYQNDSFDWLQWVLLVLSVGVEATVMFQFYKASRPVYSSSGALVDGGMDLNQAGGLTDFMRDALYISMACQVLCVFWNGFWWLLALIPSFGLYKLWTGVLQPMLGSR